jgi:sugar phosphate isomerase/epimerase
MQFALTTHWNAGRHTSGEALVEEILDLGITELELGYDLRLDLVPGVKKMVAQGAVTVGSLHNFCPVPIAAVKGHPEVFTFTDPDPRMRANAVEHTERTIRFAAEVGARSVVTHCGRVKMRRFSERLLQQAERGNLLTEGYEKDKLKLLVTRDKKAPRQLRYLHDALQKLLPVLEECNVRLCLENLPSWEAYPTEIEMEAILRNFGSSHIGYWHDIGHGQIRENLGLINQERWLERLQHGLGGFHIHDVGHPIQDHLMPPRGNIDFARFARFARLDGVHWVLEPAPLTPPEQIKDALPVLKELWNTQET